MNIERLLRIKAAILAEPKKFQMRYFFTSDGDSPCGTAACIAGFAIADRAGTERLVDACREARRRDDGYGDQAIDALDLDLVSGWRLFDESKWPEPYREQFAYATGREERAKIAAERIDYFILTNGTDIVPGRTESIEHD